MHLELPALSAPCFRYFHSCSGCGTYCAFDNSEFSRERCRLYNLPDLAHEVPEVKNMLVDWLKWMQANFQFDGYRVDAASHLSKVGCSC
jgi:glycosidase